MLRLGTGSMHTQSWVGRSVEGQWHGVSIEESAVPHARAKNVAVSAISKGGEEECLD